MNNEFSLDELNLDELKALRKETDVAIKNYEARRKQEARAAAEAAAKSAGYSLKELVGPSSNKASKSANPPKYRNPDDETQTWTGRGRQPKWIKDALESGRSLEDFLINK